jgi:hypothetical protein
MNANGEIMRIEYGKSGFSRSELNTENRKANQVIVNSYNERHGITTEQINTMHQGALFGWDVLQLSRQEQSDMKSGHIFEVEISRPGSFGAETSSTLKLPAAPYEILDALDKARITDERVIYSAEIIGCELDYLPQFIGTNANLYELKHLADRLSSLRMGAGLLRGNGHDGYHPDSILPPRNRPPHQHDPQHEGLACRL